MRIDKTRKYSLLFSSDAFARSVPNLVLVFFTKAKYSWMWLKKVIEAYQWSSNQSGFYEIVVIHYSVESSDLFFVLVLLSSFHSHCASKQNWSHWQWQGTESTISSKGSSVWYWYGSYWQWWNLPATKDYLLHYCTLSPVRATSDWIIEIQPDFSRLDIHPSLIQCEEDYMSRLVVHLVWCSMLVIWLIVNWHFSSVRNRVTMYCICT